MGRVMTDVVDRATRSEMMASIRGRNTGPEVALRSALHCLGLRFRLHRVGLPGRPDVVLPRYRATVFVHGCFWHRHADCHLAYTPRTRVDFWRAKFAANVKRDARQRTALLEDGWRVATVWECAIRARRADAVAAELAAWLAGSGRELEIGTPSARASGHEQGIDRHEG